MSPLRNDQSRGGARLHRTRLPGVGDEDDGCPTRLGGTGQGDRVLLIATQVEHQKHIASSDIEQGIGPAGWCVGNNMAVRPELVEMRVEHFGAGLREAATRHPDRAPFVGEQRDDRREFRRMEISKGRFETANKGVAQKSGQHNA